MEGENVQQCSDSPHQMQPIRQSGWIELDKFRRSVLQEVQKIFREFSEREMRERLRCMDDILHCSKRRFCMKAITRGMESAGLAFLDGDFEGVFATLEELESDIEETRDLCEVDECHAYALSMIGELEDLFSLAQRLMSRLEGIGPRGDEVDVDPRTMSEAFAPLTHPTRVGILFELEGSERSFSEMSRALGLKTGHLQFHLRSLEASGYIRRGPERGRYAITLKGKTALEGLRRFTGALIEVG